jgi:hypothetical protein
MTPTFDTVLFTVADDHVATITLNRPEVLNAFNQQMCAEFATLWPMIREDDSIHAVVLRAAGDRSFSTGVDVKAPLQVRIERLESGRPGRPAEPERQPGVEAGRLRVHGMAASGAFYWINESDIVICSPGQHRGEAARGRPGHRPRDLGVAGRGAQRGARARPGRHAARQPARGRFG